MLTGRPVMFFSRHSGRQLPYRSGIVFFRGGGCSPASGVIFSTTPRSRKIRAFPVIALFAAAALSPALALSETDVFPDPAFSSPVPLELPAQSASLAEAHALYLYGIFAEENEGPEAALTRYREVLRRTPDFLGLAVNVAREYLRRGDTASALAVLKDAAKARKSDFLPDFFAAEIYLRHLNKPDLAERHARRARELAPDRFAPYSLLWEIYRHTGQNTKARLVLDSAASRDVKDPNYWLELAQLHRRMLPADGKELPENTLRRRNVLRRAHSLAKENPELLLRIADLYAIFRETEDAAQVYSEALALNSELPLLRDKLAAALMELGRGQEAVPLLETIFRQNPQNLAACDQLAALALERGDSDEALLYKQKALALAPRDQSRYQELIDLLLSRQKFELAISYLRDAIARFPGSGIFPYVMGATLTRAGRPNEAIPFFEQALAESPLVKAQFVGGDFYFEFGMAAEQAGEYERAAQLFRKAIEIDPANAARAANYLGYMWVERNEHLDEAEKLIRQALDAEPNNGAYLDSLGWLFYRRGQFADALSTLLRAAELLPDPDPVVYEHIADTYNALGRTPEALLYWQKALQLDQENVALMEKIERASARTASLPAE